MHFHLMTVLLLIPPVISISLFFTTQQQELNQLQYSSQSSLADVHRALKKADIIPSILPDFTPICKISITYSTESKSKSKTITEHKQSKYKVSLGNKLKPSYTEDKPVEVAIECYDEENRSLGFGARGEEQVTIALTDPDAPSRKNPKWSEMCHWIATESADLIDYKAPGPPKGTSYHRYIFVLLAGDNSNLAVPSDRQHWGTGKERHGVADWAASQNLTIVGANFFYAKHE